VSAYSEVNTITFTPDNDKQYLIFTAVIIQSSPFGYVKINDVSSVGSANCKAYIFAENGTRQFYDGLTRQRTIYGGNMAEYVMNYNTQQILGKFLTRFDSPLLFPNNYFDISCIIPQSTIDIPYTEDGLIYRLNRYDESGDLIDTLDTEIENSGDGVYRLRLDDKIGSSSSMDLQLVRNQTNVDWFGVYYKSGVNVVQIGSYNNYSSITLDTGYVVSAIDVFANNKALVVAINSPNTKVYYINYGVLSTLSTTSSIAGNYIKEFDENNWIVVNNGTQNEALISKNGSVTLESTVLSTYFYGIDGVSIDEIYALSELPFQNAKILKRDSLGVWSTFYDFGIANIGTNGRPSISLVENKIHVLYIDGADLKQYIYDLSSNTISSVTVGTDTSAYSIDVLNNDLAIATSHRNVFLFNGSWSLDTSFNTIRTASSDASTIVSCKYLGEENIIVASEDKLYTKLGSAWSEGVGGVYVSGATFAQVDGYFTSETVELLVSENKTIEIESECAKQSIHISWINSLGNWEHFSFTARKSYEKKVDNTVTVRRNILASFPDDFTSETQDDKIRIDSNDVVTVRSQFVSKDRLDVIAEIISSIRVQAWISETEKITVIVDSDNIKKYSDGDKLYAIEFDIVYPQIQTQRQ
jgi:hypothetical protein